MHRTARAVVSMLLAASVAESQAPRRPMSFDDVMALRTLGAVQIAPNGERIVFSVSAWDNPEAARADRPLARSHLWVVGARGGPARQITFGERSESHPRWSPNGRLIAFIAGRGRSLAPGGPTPESDQGPRGQIWVLPIAEGGEASQLTDAPGGVSSYAWAPDGRSIAYVTTDSLPVEVQRRHGDDAQVYESDFRRSHVWVVDLETRKATEVAHGEFTLSGLAVKAEPSWSPDGTRLAFNAPTSPMLRELRGGVYVVNVATHQVERVAPAFRSPSGGLGRPVWSPDGRTLAFVSHPQSDTLQGDSVPLPKLGNGNLVLWNVGERRATAVHDPKFDFELEDIEWTPDGKSLLFTANDRVYQNVFRYDVASRAFRRVTTGLLVREYSVSRNGRVAFSAETPTSPTEVYGTDLAFRAPRKLTALNPRIADVALGETEVVTWRSDGLAVEGILLKPVGYQAGRRYPLVVIPHGGPTGGHENGFKGTPSLPGQVWAGRGWAVLYPNPRGSTGYGEKFMTANIGDLGGGDYRDVMAGVDDAIRRRIADSTKLAVMGWSYGGQMTAWVVTQTTRFRAASMGAGISDLLSMYGTSEISGYEGMLQGGMPSDRTFERYRDRSAITFADRVTTPLLIQHGADDPRVPAGQALEFYRALRDRGKVTQLVLYPREQHSFAEYYHLLGRMRRDYEWIATYTLTGSADQTATP